MAHDEAAKPDGAAKLVIRNIGLLLSGGIDSGQGNFSACESSSCSPGR